MAGTGEQGNSYNQLNYPQDIFIHNQTNVLYVTDTFNRRIQMISLDKFPSSEITTISTRTTLSYLFVDDEDDGSAIYVSLLDLKRVENGPKTHH